VRETLERILASETFGRSERARELLSYIVERDLAGDADKLKGFAIAMDVFGKDADFDPSTDAVVRVQAGRLRELLQQYFANEGVAEPVRIAIPRGSYVPAYEMNEIRLPQGLSPEGEMPLPADNADEQPGRDAERSSLPLARHLQFLWAAIGLVIAMLSFIILRQIGPAPTVTAETGASNDKAAITASIAHAHNTDLLPTVYLFVRAANPGSARVAALTRAGLSGFEAINFIGRDFSGRPDPLKDATSFLFRVTPGPDAGSVSVELQNVVTGRVLHSSILTAVDAEPPYVEDRIAALLTSAVSPSGMIYSYIAQANLQKGLTECLMLGDDYYLDQNAKTHEAAYRCFDKLAGQGARSPLVYSELASLHMEAFTDHYAYPQGATPEQALALAQRALQMGTTSAYAYRAYGYINSRLGNPDEAVRWLRKAYDVDTFNLAMAASYAYALIFAGDYKQGTPLMARAVEASNAHPTWWDFGLFVGEFMLGDDKKAMTAAASIAPTARKSHYLAARLIAAEYDGNNETRLKLLNELATEFPKFSADPRSALMKRNYPSDLTNRLIGALRAAGLGSGS
jgi:tetratricopeptide (TPR) repeat protein